ncbi:MAG TPA: hypothetical protein VJT15_25675 [Pyrinomonadaceae bacterium]|nr:hypothetical protein [Pyrinomonadaceae bacterium]
MKRTPLILSLILLFTFCAHAQSVADGGFNTQDGMYVNPRLGFTFNYPKDWVVHGTATNERIRELGREKAVESGVGPSVDAALKDTHQLLTVFRHPVGTPGVGFNSAILVIAEKVAHAPGIITGKDYLLNIRELMLKTGSKVLLKEPKEHHFAEKKFFRDDYALEQNGGHLVQAYFATVIKDYALVFVFMGEDQKSVDEMTKAMETFDTAMPVRRGVTTVIGPEQKRKPK